MSLVRVPGFGGIYVVDTADGGMYRVGSEGGLRNPLTNQLNSAARFDEVGGQVGTAALSVLQQYSGGGEAPMEGFHFEMPEMSPEEKQLLGLQIQSIQASINAQNQAIARENARRAAYNRYLKGERFTPSTMEEEQGMLAARAGHISGLEQERLESALAGKLPVSPATERSIRVNENILGERLRRNLGPGGETSSPGIEATTRFDESAEILRNQDRTAAIERGIGPAMTSAAFAQEAVGNYLPGEVPGLASALSGLQRTRLGEGQLGLGYAGLGAEYAGINAANSRFAAAQASDYIRSRQGSGGSGGGLGSIVGLIGGGLGGYMSGGGNLFGFGQQKSGGGGGVTDLYGGTGSGFSRSNSLYG